MGGLENGPLSLWEGGGVVGGGGVEGWLSSLALSIQPYPSRRFRASPHPLCAMDKAVMRA